MTDQLTTALVSQLYDYSLEAEEKKAIIKFYEVGVAFLEFMMTKRGIVRESVQYKKILDFYNSSFLTLARGIFALISRREDEDS